MADASALIIEQFPAPETVKERSWADLPNGTVCEIYSRVPAIDRSIFRAVCTSWKKVHPFATRILPPIDSHYPFLLFRNNKLYDPMYDVDHHNTGLHVAGKPGAIVNMAKYGWFLVTYKDDEMFFYNPITKDIVDLPTINHAYYLRSICFTAPPTSKGWLLVAAISDPHDRIVISSITDGATEWTSCEYTAEEGKREKFAFSNCNAVIHKGLYYFLGKEAKVLVHDPNKKRFFFNKANKCISPDLKACGAQQYLLESDEKLMGVFVSGEGSVVRICRWEISKREWVVLERLENKMLFVSPICSMIVKAEINGTGNKIYFPRLLNGHCLVYSLSTKRFHTLEGGSYDSFNESKRFPDSGWIKLST